MKRSLLFLAVMLVLAAPIAAVSPYEIPADEFENFSGPLRLMVPEDEPGESPIKEAEPLWTALENMSKAERLNVEIELMLEPGASAEALAQAETIERLWSSGDFDQSLAAFGTLAELTDVNEITLGQHFLTPLFNTEEAKWGTDVRIGTEDEIYVVALDIHRASGNLFSTHVYETTSGTSWEIFISTDGGSTWGKTYTWGAIYHINDMDASVVDEHCYVAFTRGVDQDQVLMYRFRVSDGARDPFDGGSGYVTAFTTTSPEAIEEIALTSNQDFTPYTHRLYLVAITSYGDLKFYWDDEVAESWLEVTTSVTNASRGLGMCLNEFYADKFLWVSYYNEVNELHIDALDNWSMWNNVYSAMAWPDADYTGIGAYHDTITCFFEDYDVDNFFCYYFVSYNGGASWFAGSVDDLDTNSQCPAVCGRDGGGIGVTYRYYSPVREGRFTYRPYAGLWPNPTHYTDYRPSLIQPDIQHLGGGNFGIVYTSWLSPLRAAFYDKGSGCCRYRGDINHSGSLPIDIADLVYLVDYMFSGGPEPACQAEGDVNGDGALLIDIADLVYLVDYMFTSGPMPPPC